MGKGDQNAGYACGRYLARIKDGGHSGRRLAVLSRKILVGPSPALACVLGAA